MFFVGGCLGGINFHPTDRGSTDVWCFSLRSAAARACVGFRFVLGFLGLSQQHMDPPCFSIAADAYGGSILQLAPLAGAVETFVLGTSAANCGQFSRDGLSCTMQPNGGIVWGDVNLISKIFDRLPSGFDSLDSDTIITLQILDYIPYAVTGRLLKLQFVSRRSLRHVSVISSIADRGAPVMVDKRIPQDTVKPSNRALVFLNPSRVGEL